MAEQYILIADPNPKACDAFRQALGESWNVVGAASVATALNAVKKQAFNVVVANYDLPKTGGPELLNRLRDEHPRTLRFISADAALKEKVMCHVVGGHQFVSIPYEPATLKAHIERSITVDYGMSNSMRELVGRIRTFPTIPSLYVEVVNALNDPNATTEDIGNIIAKDMAITTKLVQVINSAYFSLPRTITDPTEAVGILGFEVVKSLIMTLKLLSQHDKVKPVYFSIDSIWRHSTNVAGTARVVALLETGDQNCSSTAYTAGLMHDLGKVILAANFDSQYNGAHAIARKQQIPLWEVEKDIFGATHGEIGAYLLGLWGLSPEVVKVAALHHHPLRTHDREFSALTAVHVANTLEYEGHPDPNGLPPPALDAIYLQELGLEERVQLWREAERETDPAYFGARIQRKIAAKTSEKTAEKAERQPAAPAPKATKATPTELPPQPPMFQGLWKWLGIGLGVSAALVLLIWLEFVRLDHSMEKSAVQADATSPPATQQKVISPVEPTRAVVAAKVAPAPPADEPKALVADPSPAPSPQPAPAKTGFDVLKLQAIFFSARHPTALINGKLTAVNQEVAGCRVLDISPSSVTMTYEDQSRILTLR